METISTFINELSQTLRLADFIDVTLVALFFYGLISWIRMSTSRGTLRRIGVVLLVYVAVYFPARFLEMHLVGRVAEIFIIALILAVIVVFQSELRRMLDQAGTWMFSSAQPVRDSSTVDVLVKSVAHMAENRTGALIVLGGKEPWEHHVQGGVELKGKVSPPLLYSLFENSTPGHDGAAIMKGSSIEKFAAHLPLTEDESEVSEYGGTRHAAALGMAQHCDAFVIVVSEERGTISLANEGTIQEMANPSELRSRLQTFWEEIYGEKTTSTSTWFNWSNMQTAVLSLILAAGLWLTFAYSPGTIYRSFEVPIEYRNVPTEWMLQDGEQWADVTISGPEQAFRLINPEQLAIGLNMEDLEVGLNEFSVDRGDLDLPDQLTLEVVQPQTVQINAVPLRRVRLPVRVSTEGTLPDGLEIQGLTTVPDSVEVLIREDVNEIGGVSTEIVDLSEISEDQVLERQLVIGPEMRFMPNGDTSVEVQVDVEEESNEEENDEDS